MINLEPDQINSINGVIAEMSAGHKSVLLQGATGSGKSYIGSDIIHRSLKKNKSSWFMVPRRDLVRQMHDTFYDFGIPHGYIASGEDFDPFNKVYIASTDTVKLRLDKLRAPDLALIDETHYGGDGLDRVIKWLKSNGSYIIGLSATPWKSSGKGLGCWYDKMVVGPSIRWLIDNKRLSEYKAFAPQNPDLSMIDIVAGDYAKGQLNERMEEDRVLIGNAVRHYKNHAMGKLGVTFGVSIKHSELLAQEYRNNGIPAMHMDGNTPEDKRIEISRAFAKRELLQICNAELMTFGYDLSSASGIKNVCIETMNDCQPTKSIAKQRQKNGRVLRYDVAPHLIFDHANNIQEHGMPCDDIEWSLEDRKTNKRVSSERTLPARQCSSCSHVHTPKPICPNCGFVYPVDSRDIEVVEGELQELNKEQIVLKKKKSRMEVGRALTIDDLKRIAKDRNYSPGWVFVMAKKKGIYK